MLGGEVGMKREKVVICDSAVLEHQDHELFTDYGETIVNE